MERVSVGDIVFVRFPFTDLSHYKLRPAIIMARLEKDDYIMCQITSKNYHDKKAILIQQQDFSYGSLNKSSYIRPSKLFTANASIIEKTLAHIKNETRNKVIDSIINIFKSE